MSQKLRKDIMEVICVICGNPDCHMNCYYGKELLDQIMAIIKKHCLLKGEGQEEPEGICPDTESDNDYAHCMCGDWVWPRCKGWQPVKEIEL